MLQRQILKGEFKQKESFTWIWRLDSLCLSAPRKSQSTSYTNVSIKLVSKRAATVTVGVIMCVWVQLQSLLFTLISVCLWVRFIKSLRIRTNFHSCWNNCVLCGRVSSHLLGEFPFNHVFSSTLYNRAVLSCVLAVGFFFSDNIFFTFWRICTIKSLVVLPAGLFVWTV